MRARARVGPLVRFLYCARRYQLHFYLEYWHARPWYILNTKLADVTSLIYARDKRMSVVNELISEVKFVKFFAFEERWIDKAQSARLRELKLVVRGMSPSLCLTTCAQ